MIWQLQETYSFGTSTPAVARTAIQGRDILNCFAVASEDQRKAAGHILMELQGKLLRCVEIYDLVDKAVTKVRDDVESGAIQIEPGARMLRPPTILDLQSKAESFLQGAKLALAQATRLTEPFYGKHFGHKLNRLEKWAVEKFGEKHHFVKYAQGWQPMVKEILTMRDAVDHPASGPGKSLHVKNFWFEISPEKAVLMEPRWWLEGEVPKSMRDMMAHYIEGIIRLQEEMLAILFYEHIGTFPIVLHEISPEKRDPVCPIRMQVGIAAGYEFD